ncbi:MAG: aspartate kinase [Prevotellaceae bacterium]|jgi:aspartate kinase|nr:aspartate kinase [Prevotellaceae bacterium]
MLVQKFGGTSVGSAERMKSVAHLIADGQRKLVVLSAMSGTTNSLLEISACFSQNDTQGALVLVQSLEQRYNAVIDALYATDDTKKEAQAQIQAIFNYIRAFADDVFTPFEEKTIVAQGELISTTLFSLYLQENSAESGVCALIPALDFMRIDQNGEPDMDFIAANLKKILAAQPDTQIFVTQGFICRNNFGEIDNLQRGGSDYTASLVGAAVGATEIQIWTDIDGMHDNDPRYVEGTHPVPMLSFDEAAELAYFGAKILHPTCILPAKLANIPVRLLNTMEPAAAGTLIATAQRAGKIEAVAAKDGITAIKIKSGRMLLAFGFLRKVFEIFESYQTPIDMVTTSEVGVSVTIDNNKHLNEIVNDLQTFGTVTVDKDMVIVCVVGDLESKNIGFQAKIVGALQDIPVRMISYGGSNHNVSLLISAKDRKLALEKLSETLFKN